MLPIDSIHQAVYTMKCHKSGLFFDVHSITDLIWSTFLQPPTTSAEDVSAENWHIDQSHLQLSLAKSDDICWLVIHSFHVPYPPMTTPTTHWEQLDLRDEDFQIPLPLPQHEARELREKLGQLEAKPITTRWWQRESVEFQTGLWPLNTVTKNRYVWTLALSLSLSRWQNQGAFQAGFQKETRSIFDLKISSNTKLQVLYLHVFANVLQKSQGSLLLADSAFPGCSGMNSNLQRCGRCFMRWPWHG